MTEEIFMVKFSFWVFIKINFQVKDALQFQLASIFTPTIKSYKINHQKSRPFTKTTPQGIPHQTSAVLKNK